MNKNNVLSTLGLAARAGKAVSGEFMTESAVKAGNAALVIVATDASANTKKKFRNMCEYRGVSFCEYSTKEELGHSLGKEFRASLAVTDQGFAQTILKKMD